MRRSSFILNLLWSFWLLYLTACSPVEEPPSADDTLLARVYNKSLYLSEISPLIPANLTEKDSSIRLHSLVEQWIRDALLMHEAEKNIPKDLNIDKLVRDYRSSLILHNYEKMLIENMLDSVISQAELKTYFEANKEQYTLESPVIRCFLIQFPEGLNEEADINTFWNKLPGDSTAYEKVKDFALLNATTILLTDTVWHRVEHIESFFPNGNALKLPFQDGLSYQLKEKGFNTWCKIIERREANEPSPFGFIEPQLKRLILHKRKLQLLTDTREDIYQQETSRSNVEVFIK